MGQILERDPVTWITEITDECYLLFPLLFKPALEL